MPERDMVSATAGTGAVKCPHFRAHSKKEIHCDGVDYDSKIIWRYVDPERKHLQFVTFCCGRWQYCEWHQTLERMRE